MGSIAIAGSNSIAIGTTPITGGTDECILFQKGTVIGEDTRLVFDYTNDLLTFGLAGGNQVVSGAAVRFQVLNSSNADFDFGTITYSGGGVGGWAICASNGSGPGHPGASTNGQFLFFIGGNGDDGTGGFQTANAFAGSLAGTCSPTAAAGRLEFYTCAPATITLLRRMLIDQNGVVTIAADSNSNANGTGALWNYNIIDNPFSPSSYERAVFDWITTSNVLTIGAQKGGSGTLRAVQLVGASITAQNASLSVAADTGGIASTNTISSANSTTISTGTGTVKMSSANNANNTGWLKCYIGTQVAWIPCWTTNAP